MPVRIVLLAKDIKMGTEILDYAITTGAAVVSYEEQSSPLAVSKMASRRSTNGKATRKVTNGKLRIVSGVEMRAGTKRLKAYRALGKADLAGPPAAFVAELMRRKWGKTEATQIVAALRKRGAIA